MEKAESFFSLFDRSIAGKLSARFRLFSTRWKNKKPFENYTNIKAADKNSAFYIINSKLFSEDKNVIFLNNLEFIMQN
jgi:hypothetical protein